MVGKLGRKTETSKPADRAASSAHKSGPSQPPEIMLDPWGNSLMRPWTDDLDENFLDPTTPTLMPGDITTKKHLKSSLRHHSRSFFGCFSCRLRKNIDYGAFRKWKNNPGPVMTNEIASALIQHITNYYDFITTAPPSKHRDLNNYCCFVLCESISSITGIPFVISFQRRVKKSGHGRFASLEAEKPILIPGWEYRGKSILFVDDFITSGMTAKTCYEILREYNNHIDGLIYCEF